MATRTSVTDVVTHPVRLRIVQQLGGRRLTTAELREALPDVTQATLYRHVASLVEAGILEVVGERRVRGAVERTLALGERMAHVDHDELQMMSDAQLRTAFLTFLGDVSGAFDRSVAHEDPTTRDFLGFGATPLYVTTDDLAAIQAGLGELLAPYLVDDGQGKRRVSLATVLVPEPENG
ncbi:helix-turn-helix domain-containing protein [Mumia quercus]|uniref:helix-turn-helix domain-containing protein n=1 Tax=Mumia quercus TaxID=2976125 RepID=UPI0021CE6CCC|nr:helix-turn-helix domain-containing protein [Mumia quercus]